MEKRGKCNILNLLESCLGNWACNRVYRKSIMCVEIKDFNICKIMGCQYIHYNQRKKIKPSSKILRTPMCRHFIEEVENSKDDVDVENPPVGYQKPQVARHS